MLNVANPVVSPKGKEHFLKFLTGNQKFLLEVAHVTSPLSELTTLSL